MSLRTKAAPWLMAISGASALAYETVWLRQLSRAFGVTVYAVASLVALYMGGLAAGAALAARRRGRADWLRVYAALEAGAGVFALAATWWLWRLPGVVAALSADSALSWEGRLLLAAPALLPPTLLLGATLPVLAGDGASAALLYGSNTLGALAGLAIAAFVTIGIWGERATVALACGLNALAVVGALACSGRSERQTAAPADDAEVATVASAIPFFIASGFCALGCEVLWTRQLIPLLGNSTYAFALILAAYLAGLGLGSCLKPDLAPDPWAALSSLLAALGGTIALSAAAERFIGLRLNSPDFLYSPLRGLSDFPLVAFQAAALVFPTALVLGLLFPAALRLAGQDSGAVGRLYAWNTVGGVAGSLLCGFAGISLFGANASILLLASLASAFAFAAAAKAKRGAWPACLALAVLTAGAVFYARRDPAVDIILSRLRAAGQTNLRVLFDDESPAATIAGIEHGGHEGLFINGIETSGKAMTGELIALLPSLAVDHPKTTLVICFGAGNTFRAASLLGTSVDAVELVGDVVKRMPAYYPDAPAYLKKPGNRIFIEDGRGFLLRSKERYDVIAVDASPPLYSAGAVNLYTEEFLALGRDHLTDQGVLALWLPTLSFESDYWQILRGFCDIFPHAALWERPGWSGFVILGSRRTIAWPKGELARRIRSGALALDWKGLNEARLRSGFWLPESDLRAYAARYQPLTDDKPTVEFPLARFWRREPILFDTDFLQKAARAGDLR